MTARPWRLARRRFADGVAAALVPVAACAVALGGLTAWTGAGLARTQARIEVSDGRVFLPSGQARETAVFFRISNTGGSADRLTNVTSPVTGAGMLARELRTADGRAGSMAVLDSVTLPAGAALDMAPGGTDVMVQGDARWRAGDRVPFVLHFERGVSVAVEAVVIRPGTG
ncbi:copper chaperone PCu(A)C [Streptomyces sp. NPDC050485]|uniref:copper chaperone PCu(A)C n=1 Tax=Streptomyces sp. NPDC050485 TaxID=3365617 RepID=UPI0037A4996B